MKTRTALPATMIAVTPLPSPGTAEIEFVEVAGSDAADVDGSDFLLWQRG